MLAEIKRTHLNRALSKLGLCSRGVAERWIAEGRVSVNGVRADSPEQWVDLGKDRIEVAPEAGSGPAAASASAPGTAATIGPQMPGTAAARPAARGHVYLVMNKPAGYVTTRNDELGRKTVYDLLPEAFAGGWVFPVGRLDKDSEGLLLMTDDGEWANLLTDPEFHVDKVYRVKLDGRPREGELQRFRSGIMLDGSFTLPADVAADGGSWYRVTLREGRNRQIRRMFHELGYKVKRLVRVSIGGLEAEG
ncbi:MAG: pseudouridine synthase, partial [Fibrobacteres bacterium]|nr:pseudouridine synthase [Fibrobacterota bacterium]